MAVTFDTLERLASNPTGDNVRKARELLTSRIKDAGYTKSEVDEYRSKFPKLFSGWDPFLPGGWSTGKIAAATAISVAMPLLLWIWLRPSCSTPSASVTAAAGDVAPHSSGTRLIVKTPKGNPGNLRSAPGLKSKKIAEVPSGTTVDVLGTALDSKQRWYNVDAGGRRGWMHSDILTAST